jgi:hypothetical protein
MHMQRWIACVLLVGLPWAAWAANETSGDPVQILRQRMMTVMPASFMTSGCLPAVPGSGLTLSAFACTGAIAASGASVPVVQTASTVGPLNEGNGTYWLALHTDTSTTVGGWHRQRGTHYLWQKAADKPAVTAGAFLAKLTVASSTITVVEDWRVPASYVRNGTYEATDPLYGGVADDVTDIGPALRTALAAAFAQQARIVRIPSGVYALKSSVVIPGGITVEGDGWAPDVFKRGTGTWLHVRDTAFVPIRITASGVTFRNVAFDHDQPTPGVGWAPTAYPYTIMVVPDQGIPISDIVLDNLYFYKATKGIYAGPDGTSLNLGRVNIRNIYGQFFTTGLETDYNLDISRIENVHLWPYWSVDTNVIHWQRINLTSVWIGRCDGCWLTNIFSFASYIGVRFVDGPWGPAVGFQGINLAFDGVKHAVASNQTGGTAFFVNLFANGSFDAGVFAPEYANSIGLYVTGGNNRYSFVNTQLTWFGDNCLTVATSSSGGSVISLTNFTCIGHNISLTNAAAVVALNDSYVSVSGLQSFLPQNPTTKYAGNFATPENPNGVLFSQDGTFFANVIGGSPTISFGPNDAIQWLPGVNAFSLGTNAGTYDTGGVKKYVCIQDGVLTVGATCP